MTFLYSWVFISVSRRFDEDDNNVGTLRLRSFLGLYIFALLYELALSYDALKRRNTFQLVGLCLCNFGLFVYGIVQMREIRETISGLSISEAAGELLWKHYRIELILIPVFIGVCTILMIFVTWRLRAENSWIIYQSMSADLQMNRRYFTYQVGSVFSRNVRPLANLLIGLYCSTQIRFLFHIRHTTPSYTCDERFQGQRFHIASRHDSGIDCDSDPGSPLLSIGEEEVAYCRYGRDSIWWLCVNLC
jgi:hypothetical protein